MSIPLGSIRFNVVDYNARRIQEAIQQFLAFGSKRGHVMITDLQVVSDQPTIPTRFVNIEEAITHGTKFFDAAMYFSLPDNEKPIIVARVNDGTPHTKNMGEIGEALFFIFFYLLTRARPPVRTGEDSTHPVPRFLTSVLGLTRGVATYLSYASSFDLLKMDHRWIRHVNMGELGIETLNRFGLGVAGYRAISPFRLLNPRPDITQAERDAYEFLRAIALAPADWAIHPTTRDPNILSRFGNINKNAGNLMLTIFTPEDLQTLVNSKALFSLPERNLGYTNYKTWQARDVPNTSNRVYSRDLSTP